MPISNATPPPPKTPRKPAAPKTTAQNTAADIRTERSEGLQTYSGLAQAGLIAFRQYADAGAIGIHFPGIADEVAKLAETDERIAGIIDPIIQAGPYTALLTAALPLIIQLGVNHGRVKPGAMGTVPKDTLSARVEAGIAQMQAEAYRAQMAAEAEAERLREEINQARLTVPGRVE